MSIIKDCVLDIASQYGGAMPGLVTTYDNSRYHNNGTLTAATWTQARPGGLWVLNYDGANTRLACGTDVSIANIWDGGGTALVWVNFASTGETGNSRLFRKANGWEIFLMAGAGNTVGLRWLVHHSGTAGDWRGADIVPLNTWTLITMTYNSDAVANNPTIYINATPNTVGSGLVEAVTPVGTRTDDTAIELIIGNLAGQTHTLDGSIVLIKQLKYAFTAAQVRAYYHSTKWMFGVPV